MIIAGYAGIGKTTLAKLYPNTVKDFVCMPYKYHLGQDFYGEENKANPNNIMKNEWPFNYVNDIEKYSNEYKLLLIPSDTIVLSLLKIKKLPFILCYPQRKDKEIYHKRFLERGNTNEFIDIFIGGWDAFISNLENDAYGQHIVLSSDQFLADVVEGDEF